MCLHADHVRPDVPMLPTETLYHDSYPTQANHGTHSQGSKMRENLVTKGPDFRP